MNASGDRQDGSARPVVINPEHGLPESFGEGLTGRILFWIAVSFSTFQVVTSFGIPLDAPFISSITLNHFLGGGHDALGRLAGPAGGAGQKRPGRRAGMDRHRGRVRPHRQIRRVAAEPGGARPSRGLPLPGRRRDGGQSPRDVVRRPGFSAGPSASRVSPSGSINGVSTTISWCASGDLTQLDMVVGIAALLILIYLVWQVMGIALPIVATVFLAYCLIGHWLPAPLDHRGYTLEQVIEHMSFGTEGIYAVPTLVSATYIFLFILFGAFMEKAGVIDFFNDISMAAFGSAQGGPGKVCVASSALMGTVSGSGVANVVASGQFTIPLMKRFGFPVGLRRRRRGDVLDGRADHAAGHGRGRVHHGRDHRRALRQDRRGGDHPGAPLFRRLLSGGASGSRQTRPQGPAARRTARTPGRKSRRTGT